MVWPKSLPRFLNPWWANHNNINSTHDFVEQVKHLKLAPGKCLSSYDVPALFTSVPVDLALRVVKNLLEKDNLLNNRTVLPVKDIIFYC